MNTAGALTSRNSRMSQLIRVLIVEDQELLRIGIRCALQQMKNVQIIGMAFDGISAVEKAQELEPDLILMDIGLPGLDGLEAMRRIKASLNCRVLILTSHEDQQTVCEAFSAGADGYCVKGASAAKLGMAINMVANGIVWLDERITQNVQKKVV
jgi:DNA-binding NarL/FixJ family response regulator